MKVCHEGAVGFGFAGGDNFLAVVICGFKCFGKEAFATGGERDEDDAAVVLAFFAFHDAEFLHGCDEPRDSRGGDAQFVGKVHAAHFAVGALMKVIEDHELIETEAARQPAFKTAHEQGAGAGEIGNEMERITAVL